MDDQLPPSFQEYAEWIKIDPTAVIAPTAAVKLFNRPGFARRTMLEIGPGCHIFSTFSLLHSEAQIKIGPRCQLGASSFIARQSITLEGDTLMAWNCTVIDTDAHSVYWAERAGDVERCLEAYRRTDGHDLGRLHDWSTVETAPIVIGRKTWIGFGASILKGVHIGEGCVVGAGSVVTRSVPAWHAAAGNPCRPVRPISAVRGEAPREPTVWCYRPDCVNRATESGERRKVAAGECACARAFMPAVFLP